MLMEYASRRGLQARRTWADLISYQPRVHAQARKALLVGEIERECRALIQTVAAVHAKKRLVVGCRGTNDEAMKEAVLLIGSIVVLVVIIPFVWGAVYAMGGE